MTVPVVFKENKFGMLHTFSSLLLIATLLDIQCNDVKTIHPLSYGKGIVGIFL